LNIQLQKGNVVCKLEVEAEAGDGEEEQVGDYDPLGPAIVGGAVDAQLEEEQVGDYDPLGPAIVGGAVDAQLEEGESSGIWTEPIWYYEEDDEVSSAKRVRLD
jgi:hypothetical protein